MRELRFLLLSMVVLTLGSCSERTGGGAQISPPLVTFSCRTSQCRAFPAAIAFIRVTQASCDPRFDNLATAAWSGTVTCTPGTGCYAVTTDWVNSRGESLNAISAGPYTICGRLDFNNNFPLTTDDDPTATIESAALGANEQEVTLSNWSDP